MKKLKKDRIFLVPHSHYDAVWIFEEEEYQRINEEILSTAISLMERYKDFKFIIEQMFLLEKIKENNPELFEKIERFVDEGKIEICSGEYLMPDLMFPHEEVIIRNIKHGRELCKMYFGYRPVVMWQADSFGLNAQIPQLCRLFGYKYIAFRRGSKKLQPCEFLWQGLDGSKVIAHFMPLGYRAGLHPDQWERNYKILKRYSFTNNILMPCGSGVTIPRSDLVDLVKKWNEEHETCEMKIALPREFFKCLEKHSKDMIIVEGEMYSSRFSEIFPDTSSSRSWIKREMRELERLVFALERLHFLLWLSKETKKEKQKKVDEILTRLWDLLFFLSFHDVVPGTCVDEIYHKLRKRLNEAFEMIEETFSYIFEDVKTASKTGNVKYVFNILPYSITELIDVKFDFKEGQIKSIGDVKVNKKSVPFKIKSIEKYEDSSIKSVNLLLNAELKPLGFTEIKVLEKKNGKKEMVEKGSIIFVDDEKKIIDNGVLKIQLIDNGTIKIFENEKLILEGNEIIIDSECGDLYIHKKYSKVPVKTESKEGIKYGMFKHSTWKIENMGSVIIAECNADYYSLRWPYRVEGENKIFKYRTLSLIKQIFIYPNSKRIDFKIKMKNEHTGVRVGIKFKYSGRKKRVFCDAPFGFVERKDGRYPCARALDIGDEKRGAVIINFGNPEYSVKGKEVCMILFRSISKLSDGTAGPIIPVPDAEEKKEMKFEYAIFLRNEFNKEVVKQIDSFLFKPLIFPKKAKFNVEVLPENVRVLSIRKISNRKFVVRVCECIGEKTKVVFRFGKQIKNVKILDLNEEKEIQELKDKVTVKKGMVLFNIEPFQIATFEISI